MALPIPQRPQPETVPYPIPADRLRGSLMRCLMLTSGSATQFSALMNTLVAPHANVPTTATYMPRGFCSPIEAWLGISEDFLTTDQRKELVSWWLAVDRNIRLPSWDIVSTCTIEGRTGLVVIEAKAHVLELKPTDKCTSANAENKKRIEVAVAEANAELNALLPGWNLRTESHFQLCNRFAWSWKLASMGIPVVLVYLGYLHADEMTDIGQPFTSGEHWADSVRAYSKGVVPDAAWDSRIDVNGTPLRAIVRSLALRWDATSN